MSSESTKGGFTRRKFLIGAGVVAVGAGLYHLRRRKLPSVEYPSPVLTSEKKIAYGDFTDVYRQKWTWDKVAKCTHTRANCISACAWDVYVREGIAWREEQAAIYQAPRPDVPDLNPRGCQKGACYTDLMYSESRVVHPLKRVGERGAGEWKRMEWDDIMNEIADHIIDAGLDQGAESVIFDHGTTNAGYGPETAGEMRFAESVGASIMDSWSGVGDMPMGCVQTWGMYNCEGTAADWFMSDYIVIWIGNPVYTRIPEVHFMHEARYRGAKLVVIAPELSPSTVHADMWMNVKPESDAALGMATARIMIEEGLFDADYVREQTDLPFLVRKDNGRFLRESDLKDGGAENALFFWDETKDKLTLAPGCEGDGEGGRSLKLGGLQPALSGTRAVKLASGEEVEVWTVMDKLRVSLDENHTLDKAAEVTGLNPGVVERFARDMAKADAAMIFASWGACKHYHSDLFQRSMALLMALTGNQGKQGAGLRVAAWWGMEGLDNMTTVGLSPMEMAKVVPKAIRGLTPRNYEDIFTLFSEKSANTPLMPWLYVHGGYKEMWDAEHLQDPSLPHNLSYYMQEAIDKGWTKIHPAPDKEPRVFIFTGCNPLRRWPAPQMALKGLWPKLNCVVSANFKMSTSSMYADYFLPVAGYYEKHGIKYGDTYLQYIITSDQAVKPLGNSLTDWEVFGRLSKAVTDRAIARGVAPVEGFQGGTIDYTKAYEEHTEKGEYDPFDPKDPVKLLDKIFRSSPCVGSISGEKALEMGAVPIIAPPPTSPIYANYSDYSTEDTHWPHGDFVTKKVAWPTLTGRQQFYIDHDWYMDAGEQLPIHKDPPHVNSKYPLRLNGGHNRWSIHAIWREHKMLLRLQRGEPVIFMNPSDLGERGVKDGDTVRVYNHIGEFEAQAKFMNGAQPGEVIIYHAWEPYQFKNWKGPQEPVEAPWKGIHLAGGYGQLHYRMFYSAPSHAPRGAPIEVELVASA